MNNFVSVIVTCYNHEAYIKQCLESIEQQTYRNFELIIINDGSTDRSAEVIEAFVEQTNLEKVTFLSHENIGLVKTRNKAFDVLKGEFVLFVDSDNYLTPNFLEELVQKAQESQGDIIYTRLINPDTQREVLPLESFSLSRLFKSNFIDSCSLVRRSIIGDVRYDDYLNGKRLEDFDFFLYLITQSLLQKIEVPKRSKSPFLISSTISTGISAPQPGQRVNTFSSVISTAISAEALSFPFIFDFT